MVRTGFWLFAELNEQTEMTDLPDLDSSQTTIDRSLEYFKLISTEF